MEQKKSGKPYLTAQKASVFRIIQCGYGKIQARKTSNTGTFHAVSIM